MKVRQMQEQMNRAQGNTSSSTPFDTSNTNTGSAAAKGDYIDFEEVK
jgi:hypothetical protein